MVEYLWVIVIVLSFVHISFLFFHEHRLRNKDNASWKKHHDATVDRYEGEKAKLLNRIDELEKQLLFNLERTKFD